MEQGTQTKACPAVPGGELLQNDGNVMGHREKSHLELHQKMKMGLEGEGKEATVALLTMRRSLRDIHGALCIGISKGKETVDLTNRRLVEGFAQASWWVQRKWGHPSSTQDLSSPTLLKMEEESGQE